MTVFTFEVLPCHPRPLPLESLTGYLTRVAELNGVPSIDVLAAVCFPGQERRIIRNLSDLPPLELADAARSLARSESELRALTFYHLARKFNRSTHPQAISRFLSGSLSPSLRWCPVCLAESTYYRLNWRFISLTGCPHHGCALLETCPHCAKPVPLFKAPLQIGHCPHCEGDLRAGCSRTIDRKAACEEDALLTCLLTPHPIEDDPPSAVYALGRRFLAARTRMGLSIRQAPKHIGLTRTVLEGIEFHSTDRRGCAFRDYRRYADFVGLDLGASFMHALADSAYNKPVAASRSTAPHADQTPHRCHAQQHLEGPARSSRTSHQWHSAPATPGHVPGRHGSARRANGRCNRRVAAHGR